jgi:hypothetical protein
MYMEDKELRKITSIALSALVVASMASAVSADEIVVRSSIGSGEVVFTEGEETDMTIEELTELVKEAAQGLNEVDFDSILCAQADITLNMGGSEMPIQFDVIGDAEKEGSVYHAAGHYSSNMFGSESGMNFDTYSWTDGETSYSAVSTDGDEWEVTSDTSAQDMMDSGLEQVDSFDSSQIPEGITLRDHLYEQDDHTYYALTADADSILDAAGSVDAAADYVDMVSSVIGDNDISVVILIDAETFLPHILAVDASDAYGTLPGAIMGLDSDLEYSANDLYATLFIDLPGSGVEIPDEVLEAAE